MDIALGSTMCTCHVYLCILYTDIVEGVFCVVEKKKWMLALFNCSKWRERSDAFAVPFVMGAAGDISEGEVGEAFRLCSSLLLLTQTVGCMELHDTKLSNTSLGCPNLPWYFCGVRADAKLSKASLVCLNLPWYFCGVWADTVVRSHGMRSLSGMT